MGKGLCGPTSGNASVGAEKMYIKHRNQARPQHTLSSPAHLSRIIKKTFDRAWIVLTIDHFYLSLYVDNQTEGKGNYFRMTSK